MIIVTGGIGFIGSNLVRHLNKRGYEDIVVFDDLEDGQKLRNIFDLKISDIFHFNELCKFVEKIPGKQIDCIFHLGACSDTTEWNGKYLIENNFHFSKKILELSLLKNVQFIYASSASVYGLNKTSEISPENEKPINGYAYSKLLFDQHVRRLLNSGNVDTQIVGLRYFNVYGPNEHHKEKMASVIYHFYRQVLSAGEFSIFGSYNNVESGEHSRDFVYVDDVTEANIWFLENPTISGIFNLGTGKSFTYNQLGDFLIKWFERNKKFSPKRIYIDFPESLKGCYQDFTRADLSTLRREGFHQKFLSLEAGMNKYLDRLNAGNE